MATIQTNGSATTGTYRTGGSTRNNRGTAINIGTSSSVLKNNALGRTNVSVFGSTVVDGNDTDKAISGGVIAHNHVKPITARVTTELAGVSNNALVTTALVPSQLRLLHKRESYKVVKTATAIRSGYWNIYTGKWTTNPVSTTEDPGVDYAATVSRSSPGKLVYRTGSKLPVRDNYKSKTG